ncbi:MAG TPA: RNA polymerase sigma factor RpoH [Azospirillaceae bacterium]|nr:RNA polymerase sigma factor RpoH [Azospirillaceae bacterium]
MKNTQVANDIIPHEDALSRAMREAGRFPLLTSEEEQLVSRRWRDNRDPKAMETLVQSHLRLVAKIARGFSGYGLPVADLIAEGHLGLMQAVEKFDPDKGFRFNTYAVWWIRAAIQTYILHNWSLVKMGTTAAQKKLFFNLRRLKAQLTEMEVGDLRPETVKAIAEELNVPEQEVIEMNRRLAATESSLNAEVGEDGDAQMQDFLVDERPSQETLLADRQELTLRRKLLERSLAMLSDRERRILVERRLRENPTTLEELGKEYAVSRERVRQIEARAFEKLQKAMRVAAQAEALPLAA